MENAQHRAEAVEAPQRLGIEVGDDERAARSQEPMHLRDRQLRIGEVNDQADEGGIEARVRQ